MSNITLFCWIQGDDPNNIFEVEIERNKSIGDLKEEIKKKEPNAFIDADIDKLLKIDILLGESDKLIEEVEVEEFDTTKRVVEYFSDEFSGKQIHIIVQRERINVVIFGLT